MEDKVREAIIMLLDEKIPFRILSMGKDCCACRIVVELEGVSIEFRISNIGKSEVLGMKYFSTYIQVYDWPIESIPEFIGYLGDPDGMLIQVCYQVKELSFEDIPFRLVHNNGIPAVEILEE